MIYEYILCPIGRLIGYIWTNCVAPLLQTFFNVLFDYILGPFYSFLWNVLYSAYKAVRYVLGSVRRCILEWNVTKLNVPTTNEHLKLFEIGVYYAKIPKTGDSEIQPFVSARKRLQHLKLFEIGVYYAKIPKTGDSEIQTVRISEKAIAEDEYVYFWLRNNDEARKANAKISIYGRNDTKIDQKRVRLNVRKGHGIPISKRVFQDEPDQCKRIKIKFVFEDVQQTKQDQSNQATVIDRNTADNNANNDGNNEADEMEDEQPANVAVNGDGALYIAIDAATKCKHEFLLCYER
eukprot:CAMPEP_0197076804 /NCGR_PEP_ID=MMETSP1384-20130603/212302_1 /TAXON_ID=29189 /ORGANISM="Ammonia sp." /LENGTH=291 /DNA_ID=CAMNT_0042515663 /DNA_START=86 /DNA_END=962 /DNA_ORIENTATION=-